MKRLGRIWQAVLMPAIFGPITRTSKKPQRLVEMLFSLTCSASNIASDSTGQVIHPTWPFREETWCPSFVEAFVDRALSSSLSVVINDTQASPMLQNWTRYLWSRIQSSTIGSRPRPCPDLSHQYYAGPYPIMEAWPLISHPARKCAAQICTARIYEW